LSAAEDNEKILKDQLKMSEAAMNVERGELSADKTRLVEQCSRLTWDVAILGAGKDKILKERDDAILPMCNDLRL